MSDLKEGYIRYSNAEEREAAIMQAESLGFTEWYRNKDCRHGHDAIFIHIEDMTWHDTKYDESKDIPLQTKHHHKVIEPKVYLENVEEMVDNHFMFLKDKYTKTESDDGTVTLKPKNKVKVWITTWGNEFKRIEVFKSFNKEHYDRVLNNNHKFKWTLLETIEREYEI